MRRGEDQHKLRLQSKSVSAVQLPLEKSRHEPTRAESWRFVRFSLPTAPKILAVADSGIRVESSRSLHMNRTQTHKLSCFRLRKCHF